MLAIRSGQELLDRQAFIERKILHLAQPRFSPEQVARFRTGESVRLKGMADNSPSPRRRFQFRLRTLMITVTVLALIAGATTWVIRDRERLMRERDGALEREQIAIRRRANTSADLWDIIDQYSKLIHHMKASQAELERKVRPDDPIASSPK